MLGWAVNDGPAQLWDCENPTPWDLIPFLVNHTGTIRAHNAPFEMAILQNTMGYTIHLKQWQDSQVMAYSLSFAGGLGNILSAINVSEDVQKIAEGTKLINRFCKPAPKNHKALRYNKTSHPEEWARFENYCKQDVSIMRTLWQWCDEYHPVSEEEWTLWRQDRIINQRGLPIDTHLVDEAIRSLVQAKFELQEEIFELTELPKITPQPLLKWINDNGCDIENMQKATKEKALKTDLDPAVRKVIEAHLLIAQASSSSKWNAIANRGDVDCEVLRETTQFVGAGRTGRWCLTGDTMITVLDSHNLVLDKRIPDVLNSDLVWDGQEFVSHDGVVFSGNNEVITYDGITGTGDHRIFTEQGDTVSLSIASEEGLKIATTKRPTKDNVDAARHITRRNQY